MNKSDVRTIEPIPYVEALQTIGEPPRLAFLPISQLVVERAYQREISSKSIAHATRIARNFDWAKCSPLVVAPLESGLYAIIDGQHRATAMVSIGINEAPCQIAEMTFETRAAAFVAVNTDVSALTPMAKYWARVAANDEKAVTANKALTKGGGRVVRSQLMASRMKPGDTLACGSVLAVCRQYGPEVLELTTRAIVKTGDGNAGLFNAISIRATGRAIGNDVRLFRRSKALLDLMHSFDFRAEIFAAKAAAVDAGATRAEEFLARAIRRHLIDDSKILTLPAD